MSFYKLENATITETKKIINKLDEEDKKDYTIKAASASYISNEVFSILLNSSKDNHVVLAQVFSELHSHPCIDSEVNPKLKSLLKTGYDFSQVASQCLSNSAHKMNAQTVAYLIEKGADPSYDNNSALNNALAQNNTPVVNELLKHSDNAAVYENLVNNDNLHFTIDKASPQQVVI